MHLAYGALLASILMDVAIKLVSTGVSTWAIVAWRWLFSIGILIPFALFYLKPHEWKPFERIHLVRAVLNLIGTFCLFYALQRLQLSVVIAIFFAEPLLTSVFAALVGREHLGPSKWVVSVLGFAGVTLVIIGANGGAASLSLVNHFDALVALAGATAWALMAVLTKRDGGHLSALSLLLWISVAAAGAGVAMSYGTLTSVGPRDIFMLLGAAVLGTIYSLLWINGLKRLSASAVASVMYLSLALSYLVGFAFFGEVPPPLAIVGSAILFCMVMLLSQPSLQQRFDQLFYSKVGLK
jgi:drug/metabolite transporter (DMT)-like permease